MASFTPEQKNIILNRGFQGAEGYSPLIPVESHEISFVGFSFYEYDAIPQQIYNIGDIVEWCDGNINKSAIFWVSAITAESDDYYNNSVEIAVTIGNDGNGHGTIRIQFADENDNPNISNYEGLVSKTSAGGDFLYSGNCYLCLAFVRGELLFTVSHELITALNYSPIRVVTARGFTPVNGTQWGSNKPFLYWLEQNNSDFYDPETQVPPIGEGGGGGGFYRPSDTDWFSPLPSLNVLSFGFISQYKLGQNAAISLSNYLWSDNFIDNIKKAWQSPFDNIISLAIVPLNAELPTTQANIKIGNLDSGITSDKLTINLVKKNFGYINLKEMYNNFADYAPFTRLNLYLPAVGIKTVNPDDYMDGELHLEANIDTFSGTIVYQLGSVRHGKKHIVDHYEGSVVTQIPITGANFIDMYKNIISGIATVTSGAMMGSALAVPLAKGASAANQANNIINTGASVSNGILNIKPTYEKTGSVSGSAMRLSMQTPYLFFDTPQLKAASAFRKLHGYVSNQYEQLKNCKGFTSIKYMDIHNIDLTEDEKSELEDILTSGVYIN